MTLHSARRISLLSISLGSLTIGCGSPPTLTGTDQVPDNNVVLTETKDSRFREVTWPEVDNYITQNLATSPNQPGCAVGISRGDEIVYLRGYGLARLGTNTHPSVPWGVETVGLVGSVSKTFTAAAVMKLLEEEGVSLTDTVGDYIASGNPAIDQLSIFALLTHTSGAGGNTEELAFAPDWYAGSFAGACVNVSSTFCEQVSRDLAQPWLAYLNYAPSTVVANLGGPSQLPFQGVYSNVGYSILGAIIDHLSGSQGYEAWVWENIGQFADNPLDGGNLLSLALAHSWRDGEDVSALDIPNLARGYDGNGFEDPYWDDVGGIEGWEGPSGGWAMTIGDLTRFAMALNDGQIVGGNSLNLMRSEFSDLGFDNNYGLGILLGSTPSPPGSIGEPDYWHGGIIGGHTAAWTYWPDQQQGLSVNLICNNNVNPFNLRDHATFIGNLIRNSNPTVAQPAQLGPMAASPAGSTYSLDLSHAYISASASDSFLPLSYLAGTLEMQVLRSSASTITVNISQTSSNGLSTKVVADWTNPYFATRPKDVEVQSTLGPVDIEDFVLAGGFYGNGDGLAQVSLSGMIDLRQAQQLGMDPQQLCSMPEGGNRCEVCADGQPMCLEISYEGITAQKKSPKSRGL